MRAYFCKAAVAGVLRLSGALVNLGLLLQGDRKDLQQPGSTRGGGFLENEEQLSAPCTALAQLPLIAPLRSPAACFDRCKQPAGVPQAAFDWSRAAQAASP